MLIAALFLLTTSPAYAIKGTYLRDREFPDNVCKIGFFSRGSTREPQFICTGTVISKTRVLTAAHCDENLKEYPDAYVLCGGTAGLSPAWQFGRMVRGHARSPQYAKSVGFHDIAVFEIDGEFEHRIAPVPLETSTDPKVIFNRDLNQCRIFGYGKDNNGTAGFANGAQFQLRRDITTAPPYSIVSGPNRAAHGDSGGPVLCPAGPGQPWTQIAITISIPKNLSVEVSYHERFFLNNVWLRETLQKPKL